MSVGIEYLVLGSTGLVGSAVVRRLALENLDFYGATREDADLTVPEAVDAIINRFKPRVIVAAAARVGGLMANDTYPVEFLTDNILSQTFLMTSAHRYGVERFVFLGSSCIYPRESVQPITEEALLTGPLEKTNEAYAIAKIAGVKLVQSYRREYSKDWLSVMPTNLYGINDNFDLRTSHVLPALIRKFHDAKSNGSQFVELWGTGDSRREFMLSDDFAEALLFLINNYSSDIPINVGTGEDVSIRELAEKIKNIIDFQGEIVWNKTIPDGTQRKLLDVSRLHRLGWRHSNTLQQGVEKTYEWFQKNYSKARLSVSVNT